MKGKVYTPNDPLPEAAIRALHWIDGKDRRIAKLEKQVKALKTKVKQ